ncbi:MAG: hypothetical protein KGP28_11600, partial [Bdellovibrionales bacterium]|nr:hypothetical protein [Bdellovibrionales bacterium]
VSGVRIKYFSGPNCAYSLVEDATHSKSAASQRSFAPPADGLYSFKVWLLGFLGWNGKMLGP